MDPQTYLAERIKALEPELHSGDLQFQRSNLAFLNVDQAVLVSALTRLRHEAGFTHLVLLTAVDWIESARFQLTYLLHNPQYHLDLGVRVRIGRENPSMRSIHHLWPTAATYQRELKEMFGIDFPGSPRVDQPLILEGWIDIPPYRRDFDTLKYSQKTYFPRPGRSSQDPETHMREKLYPERGDDHDPA